MPVWSISPTDVWHAQPKAGIISALRRRWQLGWYVLSPHVVSGVIKCGAGVIKFLSGLSCS